MSYYVYIVECVDKTYYTGLTKNLDSRIKKHNFSKLGAKYTRSRRPVKLIYSEKMRSKGKALKREFEIKKLTREGKEKLVTSPLS